MIIFKSVQPVSSNSIYDLWLSNFMVDGPNLDLSKRKPQGCLMQTTKRNIYQATNQIKTLKNSTSIQKTKAKSFQIY